VRYKPLHTLILLTLILGFSFNGFSQTSYLPHYTTKNGLASNNCYYLLQDRKGYIWVCTDAGVSRFDGTGFETLQLMTGYLITRYYKLGKIVKVEFGFYL